MTTEENRKKGLPVLLVFLLLMSSLFWCFSFVLLFFSFSCSDVFDVFPDYATQRRFPCNSDFFE